MDSQGAWQQTFDFFVGKPIVVEPVEAHLSTDAGLLPIRQFDDSIGVDGTVCRSIARRVLWSGIDAQLFGDDAVACLRHPGWIRGPERPRRPAERCCLQTGGGTLAGGRGPGKSAYLARAAVGWLTRHHESYVGVRVPSEIVPLTWGDVDWQNRRIVITSPKTERHRDGDKRICPIFPEVFPALQEAYEAAPEGAVRISPSIKSGEKNMGTWLRRAILAAGFTPWPRLWQNLRATRATELADQFPSRVAASWLGHSEQIADSAYRMTTVEHFEKAASTPTGPMPGENTTNGTGTESGTLTARLSPIRGSSRKENSPEKHGAGD